MRRRDGSVHSGVFRLDVRDIDRASEWDIATRVERWSTRVRREALVLKLRTHGVPDGGQFGKPSKGLEEDVSVIGKSVSKQVSSGEPQKSISLTSQVKS